MTVDYELAKMEKKAQLDAGSVTASGDGVHYNPLWIVVRELGVFSTSFKLSQT